jgi:ATP synthase protein I
MIDGKSKKPQEESAAEGARTAGLAFSIPAILCSAVVVGCLVGKYLDQWLGTSPWLLLAFLFLGLIAGVRETIKLVQKIKSK